MKRNETPRSPSPLVWEGRKPEQPRDTEVTRRDDPLLDARDERRTPTGRVTGPLIPTTRTADVVAPAPAIAIHPDLARTKPASPSFKQRVKNAAKNSLRFLMRYRICARGFDFIVMTRRSHLANAVAGRLREKVFTDSRVIRGPFAGMIFEGQDWCRWLGAYERELHGIVTTIIHTDYEQIINVGCAEGYYSVGLALRMPEVRVVSFDCNTESLETCRRHAVLNGVESRMNFAGRCDPGQLARLDWNPRTLVLCDVEGYEVELLDIEKVPALKHCDLLVEVHDFFAAGASEQLTGRFTETHTIEKIRERMEDPSDYPEIAGLSTFEQRVVLSEDRISSHKPADTQWFFMRARSQSHRSRW